MTSRVLSVWPPLPPRVYVRRPLTSLPFPLGRPTCRLYSRARHALWHGIKQLGLRPGDVVLVPAFHHGSEVEALRRVGIDCRFYDIDDALEPSGRELETLVDDGVRALYLIHYLGFPQDVPRWRAWCDERGILLIEDAAQAWLSSVNGMPVGSVGDLAIYCLYKSFGLPDGAALVGDRPPPNPETKRDLRLKHVARLHLAWLEQRRAVVPVTWRFSRRGRYDPNRDFALGNVDVAPSGAATFLIPRIAEAGAARVRRENYSYLLEGLADCVPTLWNSLPAGAAPLALPARTSRKTELLARLARRGVDALNVWSIPHPSLPAEDFPRAASLRATVVGLPVHQELRRRDLDMIIRAVRETLAGR